ncbi:MAG: hypothetical protein M1812_008540, partial [Candelaria pacifica]
WDDSTSKYKTVDSAALPKEVTGLDKYVFVVRARTGKRMGSWQAHFNAKVENLEKKTSKQVFYVNIKSDGLRDVLRVVLRDVHGLSLREDKITLERNLLYHYIPKLKAQQSVLEDDINNHAKVQPLSLLVEYIRTAYVLTTSRLALLLKNCEITDDLLWALFKPNMKICTTILDTEKPACYCYDSGKERKSTTGLAYFHVECHLLDFNSQVFGEVSMALGIQTFPEKGKYIKVLMDSHIMIDAAYFHKINPNYTRLHINELARPSSSNNICSLFFFNTKTKEVKSNGLDVTTMSEDDLMTCSQTVYGWSFSNKRWLEFVVDDIKDIVWNPSAFDNLAIPVMNKKVIKLDCAIYN